MNCTQAKKLLDRYLDGELHTAAQAELEAHLRDCAACRDELEFSRLLRSVAPETLVTPPAALREGVLERIRTGAVPQSLKTTNRTPLRLVRTLGGIAAALLLLVGVVQIGRLLPGSVVHDAPMAEAYSKDSSPVDQKAMEDGAVYSADEERSSFFDSLFDSFVGGSEKTTTDAADNCVPDIPAETAPADRPVSDATMGTIAPNGQRIPLDPILTDPRTAYGFIYAVFPAREDTKSLSAGLFLLAEQDGIRYYRATREELADVLARLSDPAAAVSLTDGLPIDRTLSDGVIIFY